MSFNREFEVKEDQVKDFLQNAVDKVKTSEDVDVLAELNKLFKKNVPLTVRKYVIAYLLKENLKHYHSFSSSNRKNEKNDKERNNSRQKNEFKASVKAEPKTEAASEPAEEKPHHPRVEIDPDKATSIFISIGKNRRVYPRDLVGILIAVGGLDRERIGDIKVLANYSFVQLYSEDAQGAIDKLNGYEYRGRKLAVSYSRQKTDADAAEDSAASETTSEKIDSGFAAAENQDMSDKEMAAEDAAAYAAAEKAAADKEPFGVN